MGITFPSIIGSGMVIEKRARIWGFCDDRNEINIRFNGKSYKAAVIENIWETFVESDCTGGPYKMYIEDIVLENVYIGHVFCMSGQSNMELPISRVRINYEKDLQQVANSMIRGFFVEKEFDFVGQRELSKGEWKEVNDSNIDSFFAAPYFFAKDMFDALNEPIGIIGCAAGGSRIESWMKEESLEGFENAQEQLRLCKQEGYVENVIKSDANKVDAWRQQLDSNDEGIRDGFNSYSYNHMYWRKCLLTQNWESDIGLINGAVWFRKTFTIDSCKAGKPGKLFLGRIIDSDYTYINGELVGCTEYQYPPRIYTVREGLLREGINTIAVWVVSERGKGGFCSDKKYSLEIDFESVSLNDEWFWHIGYKMPELAPSTFFYAYPCGLYNTMLSPIMPFTISAFLWYQGESNTEEPHNYGQLLERFMIDIRKNYGKSLPFLVVQLPNFDAGEQNENWEILRKQQTSILKYENTALIVTKDIGEDNDLHPLNKKDVGKRLASGVLSLIWKREITVGKDKVIVNQERK